MTETFIKASDSTVFLIGTTSANPYIGKCVVVFQVNYFGRPESDEYQFAAFNVGATTYDALYTTFTLADGYHDTFEETAKANSLFPGELKSLGGNVMILVTSQSEYADLETLWGLV